MIPSYVWTIIELYLTGVIHVLTAVCNPFALFGSNIPSCDPLQLSILLGSYYLRNAYDSVALKINKLQFSFGVEFSLSTYTFTIAFPYFCVCATLANSCVLFWKKAAQSIVSKENPKVEKSSSEGSGGMMTHISKLLGFLPTIRLRIDRFDGEIISHDLAFTLKGLEIEVNPQSGVAAKIRVGELQLHDTRNHSLIVALSVLIVKAQFGGENSFDVSLNSANVNINGLCESSVVECLYLAAAAQSFGPKCHRAMFAARWQTLDQQLREIEQIKIDRQVKWRGDNVDDDLFFYDAATVVSELSAAPNVIVRVGLVVLEASTGNRSEEDISIESIKFESTSTIQRSPESSVQSIRTTIEIRHIFNGTEIHPHVDELLTVESQVTKTINHTASSPLQVSSSHNIALGDLTLGISATFLRGILTLLDDVKFLGGRRGAASIPARPAAALMEHDSQSDLSTGSINILIKSDEMNGPNNLQQNVLVRLGHISKYATAHRSSIVLESLQVYLGNYDVDIQSVDGMMLYGNAIIALKTLTISLPNATDGAHYHPRSTDVTFADWIQTVYEKKGANLITEVTIKSIAVSVSQADIVSLAFLSKSICKYGTGNALNVYSSLRAHAYRVEPSCKRTTVVTIGDIVVNVATENPLQRYRILRNKQLILKLASIGTWWSSTSFLLSDDVEVMYTDGTRGGSDRLLAKIWAVTKEDGRKEAIAFTQTSSFAELHSPAHSATGVGFRMGTTSLRIPKISVVVDVEDIKPLLVIKAACQTCYPDAESRVISPREALYQPQVLFVTKTPSSVFLFENKQLKVDMYHTADRLRLPAVELTTSSLDIAQVDFAGCSSQLSIGITNLRLSEMSHPKVPHKVIIDSVEHGTFTNKFSMHITSVKGENGIFEMQAEHVRVMYLQRATMTLVTFFRDHFFGAMGEVSAHIPPKPLTTLIAPAKGMYRVCIVVRRSEFHMPSSSAGSDSLVVFFRRLVFYRTTDEYEKKLPAYIRGPYQSRKLLLSELPQVRKLIQNLADRKRSAAVDLHTTWKLPVYLHELMFTADEPPVSEGYLKLQLYEGSITSWCNSNLICTAMDAMATIKINPSIPNAEEPYETFDGDAYLMPAYTMRNTIVVEVFAEEIDWVMAQGQYWLIVNSIQQNFMEWNYHIIDPFILPIFKKVELGERIFGKDPFNRALPIASSVPVHIRKGSIIAAENDQDFLKNFLAFLPALEAFDDSFHHNFDKEIKTTVPSEAPFHRFRDPLFSRWTRSEAKREKLREYHHGLETPFALKFENLFLDFYRFHFGGGNGIEASATTLVAQQQARSEYVNEGVRAQTGSSFDDTDIRDLVLAPRHLSVFHSKEPHRSKYSAAEAPSSTAAAATAAAATEDSTKEAAEAAARHIRYSQQGVANVRRCCVYVDDTVVAVNVTTMLAIVDFFVIPIQLTSQRNLQLVDQLNKGPFDYRGGLDVEVHMDRSYVCIPDPVNGINALCFDLKVDFAQSLRGFLNVGPGLALMDLDIDINNIFMAPLNEVNDIFMKPLVDPVKFRFLNEYTVLAPKETLAKHLDALNSWSTFSSWVTELPNRYDRASGQRIMRFFIEPLINPNDDLDDEGSTFLGRVEEPKSKVIRGQCSIKDLMFILSVVNGIRKSLKRRLQNLPKGDIYRNILLTIDDLKHQMSLDEQLVCVPWAYDLNVDVKEVHAQLSNFDFHVRNNTYNVNIGRLKLEDIIIIYARGPDHMHMATEVRLDAWTFNDDMDDWEPFIEPIQLRAIGATDSSRGIDEANDPDSAEDATPSIRIDVITDGLEVNLQQQALTSLIRKVRLGDVLTTSSNRLPPYMIINELGVHCKFTIGIQSTIVLASEIHAAASYPVEVSRLADSLNTFKRQRAYQTYGDDNGGLTDMDVREYFIWISFPNFSHSYESKAALCIDKVGVHPFEMQMLKGGGKRDSQAFRKSADTTVDSQGNPEPMRYAQELPYAILDMRIKEDGVRELHLRGWLSFKNTTSRLMQISLRLYGSCFDSSLAPGKEWHAPVRYANPKAQLFIRFDHKSDWIEALPYLGMIIAGGSWGCPTKLRARLCKCYREHDDPETTEEPKWLLLVRPEAKSTKSIGLGASNTSATKASSIVVKYPNRDNNTKTKFGVGQMMDEGPDSFQIDDTQLASVISGTVTGFSASFLSVDQSQIRPVCINLQAPLQFCSFLPQPLLYRLIDQEGTYCASGILLPGQTIDIHNITQIFQRRLMVSVRMLNYAWSEYVVVFGRSNPFSNAEKSSELVLQSLLFQSPHTGKEFLLPQLSLTMVIKEFFVRFTCQVVLSNYTGQELLFAESSNPELYVPLGSVASVRDYLDANVPAKRKSLHSRAFVRRSYVNYTADNYVDSDDEEGSHESASDDGQHSAHRVSEIASSSSAPLMPPPPSLTGRLSPTPMGGGGGMFAEPGTNSRFKQIMNLKIHLPQDHQKVIEVVASSSWTLDDLFMDIKHRVDNHGLDLFASDFKFFPWIIDEKTVTAKNIQAVEDGEDDVKAAAQVRPISQNINIGNEMPLSMRFDLVMVLNNEPWNMRTPLAALNTFEMLLCHDAEVSIYRQVASIRGESISKEGIKAFFGKTRYVYKAQIARVTGEIPFKPYRMLGNPLLSISVPTETDWSAGVDVIKGEFDMGEMVITLANKRVTDTPYNPMYEFGVHLERGTGFMQQSTVATVVPKHILVSRLSYPIDIRQLDFDYAPSIVFLEPNSSCNFHYPNRTRPRQLQVKRSPIAAFHREDADDSPPQSQRKQQQQQQAPRPSEEDLLAMETWVGEIDVNKLGIVFVRLRHPLAIIKVETEVVGGSLVSTFSEQSLIWPPYRIDNKSNASVRFREEAAPMSNTAAAAAAAADLLSNLLPEQARVMMEESMSMREGALSSASAREMSRTMSASGAMQPSAGAAAAAAAAPSSSSTSPVRPAASVAAVSSTAALNAAMQWDDIEAKGSFPYTWDHPFSGNRTIRLEVSAAGQTATKLVKLDDDIKDLTVTLKKKVPNLGNPLAEGYLTRCEPNNDREVYCILRPDILYVYEKDELDPSKHELLDVINLSKIKKSGKFILGSIARMTPDKGGKDFLSNTFTDFFSNISSTVNFIRQKTKMKFDLNYLRTLMLTLGDHLGYFTSYALDNKVATTRRRTYSDEHDIGLPLSHASRSANVSTESLDELSSHSGSLPGLAVEDNSDQASTTNGGGSSSKNLRLKELLSAGASSQDLMDELQKHVVYTHQVIDAILASNDKYTPESAKELCAWLILHEYLIPYNPEECIRSFSFDGSMSARPSVFDASFLTGDVTGGPATVNTNGGGGGGGTAAPIMPGMAMPTDTRPTLSGPSTSTSSGATASSTRPTATLLGMARASKAMQYYNTLLNDCDNMEMVFVPPPLNPEMLELQMSLLDDRGRATVANTAANASASSRGAPDEVFGFTLTVNDKTFSFKCSSGDEFRGWMQSARLAIELGWVDYMTGRKPLTAPKISDYQITYHLKTRADGSTKVLEITEVGGGQDERGKKIVKRVTSTLVDAFSFLPVFRRDKRALQASNLEELKESIDADRALISVYFNVRSVSLSIIDAAPSEVMYIRLQDVVMNVIRYLRAVQFTVTVRQLQFVDQLLNPSFPVTLFTRKLSPEEAKKIVLPGFEDGEVFGYPSLHLHLQQRYFKSAKNKAGAAAGAGGGGGGGNANGAAGGGGGGGKANASAEAPTISPANTSESKLWYFDVFTIWLAPMHLGVDEEIFVRLFRFIQSVRTTLVELEAGGKTRKVHEDAVGSSSADYRLLSTDLDRHALHANYMQLVESGRSPYALFATETKRALNMYFGLLQLYPLEVSISFRPSPDVKLTNAEYAIVSIIAQLDNAKIKLNSLFAENAFGSTVIIKEIVAKHYRAAFWKQFRNLIGATDIVEGSVGLVANLGTGVYDLFNESVEGLNPNEKKSFLHGLSRGGMSLASHTIGGTSGFTSRIAGGIGKGVSMLTLDTEFQRNRTYRKYNQANTLSEGLYVGTQELGRNIVEGVTGIVVSPYRGWEQGGGVGLATGMARGILGVALKPAVGVLDLASRATEGLRNTTMQAEIGISAEIEGIRRCRIPRAFGRSGMLQIYDVRAAAAQCMADYLADFRYDPRLQVVAHLYCRRKIETVRGMTRSGAAAAAAAHQNHSPHDHATTAAATHRLRPQSSTYAPTILVGEPVEDDVEGVPQEHHHEHGGHHPHAHGHHRPSSFGRAKTMSSSGYGGSSYGRRYEESAARDFTLNPPREAWGLPECTEYVILVTPDRVALVEVNSTVSTATATAATASTVGAPSGPAPSIADVDFDGDNDAMSVSSRTTTASTIAPSVVSTASGLPPTGSSSGGGGMFGAFRSKTKKLTSMGSSSSVTAGIAGNSGATTASGASSALPPSGISPSSGGSGGNGGGGGGGPASVSVVTSLPSSANKRCRFIWVCPANCIDELSSDNRGDMQLKLNTSLLLSGAWHQRLPTILDPTLRNFTVFQSLLEQVMGVSLARQQPLHPPYRVASSGPPRVGGLLQQGIRKKYSTGIRSVLMSPSVHTYWVYGHVLYEYTAVRGSAAAANAAKHGIASSGGSAKQLVPAAATAAAAAPAAAAAGSELSDYFHIENAVDDQLSPEAAGSSSRPTSGFFGNEAAAAAAGGPPALSSSSSVTFAASGPNTFNSGATASPATNAAAAAAANNAKSPLDDLMEKTIAAIAVTPTKYDRLDGDGDDGSVRPRQRRRRSSGSKQRRQKRSDTADGASSMPPPPGESPEKDSDDDEEAYDRHRQQQRELQQTQQQLFPTETAPLTRERRSSSAGSLSDMSAASQASLSSVSTAAGPVVQPPELQDQYLSFVYPLVDLTMHGPTPEEGGKFYSISIQRMDNAKLRCLRRDDPNEALSEYMKSGLSLLFPTKELAMNWRLAIESRITLRPTDCLPPGLLTTEDKKREYGRFLPLSSRNNVAANGEKQTLESVMTPVDNSVLGVMILPTSGCAEKETETIKIEIFKTLSAVRR